MGVKMHHIARNLMYQLNVGSRRGYSGSVTTRPQCQKHIQIVDIWVREKLGWAREKSHNLLLKNYIEP